MLIFSKYKKKKVIAAYYKLNDFKKDRVDICPDEEFLQVGLVNLKDRTFLNPHKHLNQIRKIPLTQEAWIILKGSLEVKVYDLNDQILKKLIIKSGDVFILLRGGHSFKKLKKNTIIYEVKNGPYYGNKKDQKSIY